MPLLGLPPAFVPPVVVVPAANAIVPFVAGTAAAGGGAAVASAVAAPLVVGALAGVAALGAAYGLAQLWGYLNQKGDTPPAYQPPTDTKYTEGFIKKPTGTYSSLWFEWASPDIYPGVFQVGAPPEVVGLTAVREYYEDMPWAGETGTAYLVYGWDATGEMVWSHALKIGAGAGYILFDGPTEERIRLDYVRYYAQKDTGESDLLPLQPAEPAVRPDIEPEALPEPAKAPSPVVVPLPYAPPALPEAEPTTQPVPVRPARPVVAPPAVAPRPIPAQPTPATARPTTNSGGLAPVPQLPPTKTPTNVHVVNGVPIPGNGPQPTPQGMAQELGRLENKLAQLISPKQAPGGDLTDRLGLLFNLVQQLLEFMTSISGGGTYVLSSRCELDENENRVEVPVPFSGANSSFGVLSNKVDAIAELLQVHKDLKQPICRETPATGQPVTVNFVQID